MYALLTGKTVIDPTLDPPSTSSLPSSAPAISATSSSSPAPSSTPLSSFALSSLIPSSSAASPSPFASPLPPSLDFQSGLTQCLGFKELLPYIEYLQQQSTSSSADTNTTTSSPALTDTVGTSSLAPGEGLPSDHLTSHSSDHSHPPTSSLPPVGADSLAPLASPTPTSYVASEANNNDDEDPAGSSDDDDLSTSSAPSPKKRRKVAKPQVAWASRRLTPNRISGLYRPGIRSSSFPMFP